MSLQSELAKCKVDGIEIDVKGRLYGGYVGSGGSRFRSYGCVDALPLVAAVVRLS